MIAWYVEVVSFKTGKIVREIYCGGGHLGETKADKVDDGVNINLNHDEYYTRIVER